MIRLLSLFALLLAGLFAPSLRAEEPFAFATTPGKLPKNVVPRHYLIELTADLEHQTFGGRVVVTLDIGEKVPALVLNAVGLKISRAELDGDAQTLGKPRLDAGAQTVTLELLRPVPAGQHELVLTFAGKLTEAPEGLYLLRLPGSEVDRKGAPGGGPAAARAGQRTERKAVATQFEPADARRMFPCWDEPAFRATMELRFTGPKALTVVSNMPLVSTLGEASGQPTRCFAPTPAMPTYLLAVFAGEFDKLEDEVDGVKLGFFTPPGKREQARYALECTKEILRDYAEYFGTKYPLPKLDQLALPNTGAGGMENWGAIVYREDAVLFDPATSSQAQRERVYGIVAHEIAHQWFGNLVTMAWWDNLWLNEGFASWMATKQTARRHPEWKAWLRAAAGREAAMRLDARATTHPIQMPVRTESEANDVFDEITYQKGQAVIRMLEMWLGEEPFRNGVRSYLQKHALSNTTTADLWAALTEASGKDVSAFAKGWTEQPGFPVVEVSSFPHENHPRVTVWQHRFTVQQRDAAEFFWTVPVSYAPAGNPQEALLLLLERRMPQGYAMPPEGAVKANVGGVGYYRVQYQDWIFKRLLKALPFLSEADRLNLLQDTWALVEAERVPAADYLRLADAVMGTATPTELEQILGVLWQVERLARDAGRAEPLERFRAWALGFLRPQLERYGWTAAPEESPLASQLRPRLLALAAACGDAETLRVARGRFVQWFATPSALDANLRGTVLTIIGREADADTWEQLHRRAQKTASAEQKRELYAALATTSDAALGAQALALALTGELPPRDATRLVSRVAEAGRQPEAAWAFAAKNLDALHAKLTAHQANEYGPGLFAALPASEARATELEAWARKNLPPGAGPSVAKAADEIRFRAAFGRRVLPEIDAWCRARLQSAPPPTRPE